MPLTVAHGRLATAISKSNNKKIGDAAATYAAQQSCPTTCVFYNGGGCYAENGQLYSGNTKPLNDAATRARATPRDVALADPTDESRKLTSRDHALRLLSTLDRWPTARELVDAATITNASAREMLAKLQAEAADVDAVFAELTA